MSLETVELVWRIEEVFGIEISKAAAPNLQTVGDLHEFVLGALRARGESPDPQQVWERLKRIFVEDHGVSAELVISSASVVYDLGMD